MAADYTVGSAFLQVVPSFKDVVTDIAKQGAKWGDEAGTAFSKAFKENVSKGTNATVGPSTKDEADAGSKAAGAFSDAFKTRLTAALRDLPEAKITADSTDADRKISDIRAQMATLKDAKIGIDLSDTDAMAKLDELRASLIQLGAESPSPSVKVNTASALASVVALRGELSALSADSGSAGDRFSQSISKALGGAVKNLPEIKIDADSTEAEIKVAEIKAELDTLRNKTIGVDISDTDAIAKIAALKVALDEVSKGGGSSSLKFDTRAAASALESFTSEASSEVENVSEGITSIGTSASSAALRLAPLAAGISAIVVALVPVAGLLAGGLAALPTVFAGLATGGAAAVIGLKGVVGAVEDYTKIQGAAKQSTAQTAAAEAQAASQAISNAEQRRTAAQQVASSEQELSNAIATQTQDQQKSQESITNAEKSLADARVSAADSVRSSEEQLGQAQQALANSEQGVTNARVQAADSVRNAQQALQQSDQALTTSEQSLANARIEAALQIHQADEQVTSSEQALQAAQLQETTAQQGLTAARQTAAEQLKALNDQLADSALNQRAAALAVRQAQNTLTTDKATPGTSNLQLAEDQLALDQAKQAQKEQTETSKALTASAAAQRKAGVNGNAQVIQAQQSVTASVQATKNAEQALADARSADSRAAVTAQQSIAAATQAVASAQQAQANAVRSAAEAQVQAEQSVATAVQGVQTAQQSLADAQTSNAEAQQSAAESVVKAQQAVSDAQTAAAQQASSDAQAISNAQSSLAEAQQNQADTTQKIALSMQTASTSTSAAGTATDTYNQALKKLSPSAQALVKYITGTLEPKFTGFQKQVEQKITPGFLSGIKGLEPVFGPISDDIKTMAGYIGKFFDAFGKWAGSKQTVNDLKTFFDNGDLFMKTLGKAALKDLPAFGKFLKDSSPAAPALARGLGDAANAFSKWVDKGGMQKFMEWLSKNGAHVADDLAVIAGSLTAILAASTPVGILLLDQVASALAALALAAKGIQIAVGSVDKLFNVIRSGGPTVVKGLQSLPGIFKKLPGEIASALTDFAPKAFASLSTAASWVNKNVITPTVAFFGGLPAKVAKAIGSFFPAAWGVMTTVGTWLSNNVWGDSKTGADAFFSNLAANVAVAIGDFFGTAFADLTTVVSWLNVHVWQPTSSFFGGLPGAVAGSIGDFFGVAWADLKTAGTWLEEHVWGGPKSGVDSFFARLPARAGKAAGNILGGAFGELKGVGKWLDDHVWPNFKKFFSDLPKKIGNLGIWTKIGSAFTSGIQSIINVINNDLIGNVNKLLNVLSLGNLKIPKLGNVENVPKHASGAVLASTVGSGFRTNGPRAIVGEGNQQYPEYVIPTDPSYRGRAKGLTASLLGDLGVPGFAIGGTIPGIGAITGAIGGVAGDLGSAAGDLVGKAEGIFGDVTSAVVGAIMKPIESAVDGIADKTPMGAITEGILDAMMKDITEFLSGKASDQAHLTSSGSGGYASLASWLGTKYTWGGGHGDSEAEARALGVDCSGLVDQVYGVSGTTLDQFKLGTGVSLKSSLPGDLVFFNTGEGAQPGHVGIITKPGGAQMIDAPHTGSVVRYDNDLAGFGEIMGVRRLDPSITGIGGAGQQIQPGHGGGTPQANMALAQQMAPFWASGTEWNDWSRLWTTESGWSQTARNPSSGAYGIAQALGHGPTNQYPGGQYQAANPPPFGTSDPATQIAWGINYIQSRWHDPIGAEENEEKYHWYAKGGVATGPAIAGIGEAGPEAIIPLEKLGDVMARIAGVPKMGLDNRAAANAGSRTGVSINEAHFHDEADMDVLMNRANFQLAGLGR